jgi:RimJ/RimL family protein N-acetyltransferase
MMILSDGNKVLLRPIDKKDLAKTLLWRNDPVIAEKTLGSRFPVTKDMEENWYQRDEFVEFPTKIIFAIDLKSDNSMIGYTHISKIDWISKTCFFGMVIGDPESQQKGYGNEAMRILFSYAFNTLNLRKVCLEVICHNHGALSAYKKVGFSEEGLLRKQIFSNNEYHDVYIMGLLKESFVLNT